MRTSHTAVVERNSIFTSGFDTEPHECAWASEARWFVRILGITEGAELRARAQISPDGMFWIDEGTELPVMSEAGLYSIKLREFGGWLRLRADLEGSDPEVKLIIYLVLKE